VPSPDRNTIPLWNQSQGDLRMTINLIKYRVVVDILSKTFRRIGIIQERVIEQFQSHIFQVS